MAETLSPTFVGMTFAQVNIYLLTFYYKLAVCLQFWFLFQVAAICYSKLNLCLLAIEQRKYEGGDIFINPKNKVINPNAIGKL